VVSTSDLYGGTYRLFTKIYEPFGLKFSFAPLADPAELRSLITPATKMVWLETPTNPMLNVLDIKALAAEAAKVGAMVVVDNTFATPYLQRPLELGAHIVLHSATKYLGGHSDVILGLLAVADAALAERLYFIQNASGAVCGPMDSFLVLRGIKTLHVRMERHCSNAEAIAAHLSTHPAVRKVYYPGLKDHPGHAIAARQMKHFGGMVSFALHDDDLAKASAVVSKLKVFTLAESLGGVESLAGHPATMTHASIPKADREKTGVTDGLIRLSVGLEDLRDLTADLDQALSVLLTK
jgi:cystathionine beta-lyase